MAGADPQLRAEAGGGVGDGLRRRPHTRKGFAVQQRVAVKAVIIEDGKCLLVKKAASQADRQFGLWEIPGGKVEIGEPPIDALHREIKEELGIGVEVGIAPCA